nr:ionotropic receptor [Semanotus bifasciatus]
MLFRAIILGLLSQWVVTQEISVAGLFEKNYLYEKAFRYAIETVNKNLEQENLTLAPLVDNDLLENTPFSAMNRVCLLLNLGAIAVFGPRSPSNTVAIQSVCDVKEVPHITTKWNNLPVRYGTEVNFYPHPPLLSNLYLDVITMWEWKSFTVVYEDNDSLMKLCDLIHKAKERGVLVSVQQLDKYETGSYRTILKDVKTTGEKYFVVDCQTENLVKVLQHFQQVGLMTDQYSYFITNLDAHTEDLTAFQYGGSNITGIRLVNPEKEYVQTISREFFSDSDSIYPELAAWHLGTETALLIDAVHMFSSALNYRKKESSLPIVSGNDALQCNSSNSWEHGYSVINLLKTSSYEGLTGPIKFNNEGFRSDFEINLFELKEGGISDVGAWTSSGGLNITRRRLELPLTDEYSLKNKSFIVIITLTDPYGMLKETHETLTGNDRFEGFGIDLIDKLAEMEGFNYTFTVREDKKNGAQDPTTGRWSGMIGDLLEHRADLAITDFTITSDREEAVDFTVPFMNLGISILFRKPFSAPPSFFSFADPFALETWMALGVAFFVVSISFYVIGRLCPDEWTNPYPCVEEPEYLINQFSMANSIWFVTGSLMCQGSEIAPIAMSTRMVAGMWWFFCLLIVASYTANLAAFLATENPVELFSDIQSLYDNAPLHGITYGAKEGGATERFFTSAEDGIFKKIGQVLKDHPEYEVRENDEGVKRAEEKLYAFFMESTSIEYNTERHCELQQYGGLLDDKGYGIAMRKESPYRSRLSTAILRLQSSQVIDELKRKWWQERRGGGQCLGETEAPEATALGLKNVEGCFWVTIYGTILAAILVVIEYLINILKISRKAKISFGDAFKQEFKFYSDFNSNVKPVINSTSLGSSKSESQEVKSKTKSGSKSRSPPLSKTKSSKASEESKSNGDKKSAAPYGFIVPTSIEKLN